MKTISMRHEELGGAHSMTTARVWCLKGLVAIAVIAASLPASAVPAQAVTDKESARFHNVEPLEPMPKSRSDAAAAAAQVPGAAALLLEALRWRGRTASQLGLPTKLWCADFMNFVLRRSGGAGTKSRAARSFLDYGKRLDGPRVGAIAIMSRKGANNGHVGIVRGTDGKGNPIIISGNHGNSVRQSTYAKNRVLGYMMPPDYVLREIAAAARANASASASAVTRP
jgi:uncharacterized protein (TIGR02594 family)